MSAPCDRCSDLEQEIVDLAAALIVIKDVQTPGFDARRHAIGELAKWRRKRMLRQRAESPLNKV